MQITEPGSLQSVEPNPSRLGSGFVFDKFGHIVTNFHVVDGSKNNKAYITFLDGVSYEGEIIGTDPYADLAVIKLTDVDNNISSKPIPEYAPVFEKMAVLIPITLPFISNNGPPELPGFIAASV